MQQEDTEAQILSLSLWSTPKFLHSQYQKSLFWPPGQQPSTNSSTPVYTAQHQKYFVWIILIPLHFF